MTVQLNRLDWSAFVDSPNPVASALMARVKIARESYFQERRGWRRWYSSWLKGILQNCISFLTISS